MSAHMSTAHMSAHMCPQISSVAVLIESFALLCIAHACSGVAASAGQMCSLRTCPCTHLHACRYTCLHACQYTCSYTCRYTCLPARYAVHGHVRTHVYMHVCTHVHVHVDTLACSDITAFIRQMWLRMHACTLPASHARTLAHAWSTRTHARARTVGTHTRTHASTHARTHAYTHTQHIHTRMHACTLARTGARVHAHAYTHIRIYWSAWHARERDRSPFFVFFVCTQEGVFLRFASREMTS